MVFPGYTIALRRRPPICVRSSRDERRRTLAAAGGAEEMAAGTSSGDHGGTLPWLARWCSWRHQRLSATPLAGAQRADADHGHQRLVRIRRHAGAG
jgi:hypothetical protein